MDERKPSSGFPVPCNPLARLGRLEHGIQQRDALFPYNNAGRTTTPLTRSPSSSACSTAGRHATSELGFTSGVVSETTSLVLEPCTHIPEV